MKAVAEVSGYYEKKMNSKELCLPTICIDRSIVKGHF
jgi:hypothetical protein